MRVKFLMQTPNGLVDATISEITSFETDGDTLTLRRIRPTFAINGEATMLQWSEVYEGVEQVEQYELSADPYTRVLQRLGLQAHRH